MKIAGHTMGTPELTPKEAIDLFAKIGLEGIELICADDYKCALSTLSTDLELKDILSYMKSRNLKMACLTPYLPEINTLDDVIYQKEMETLKRVIRFASGLECPHIRIYAGKELGEPGREKRFARLVAALKELGNFAKPLGVTLAVENHFNTMTVTAKETMEVIHAVGLDNVCVLYDQANLGFMYAEDYPEALRLQKGYITHVHVKDFIFTEKGKVSTSKSVFTIPKESKAFVSKVVGEGIVPWREIIKELKEQGYQGYLSLEYTRKAHPEELPPAEIGMKASANYLRSILSSL